MTHSKSEFAFPNSTIKSNLRFKDSFVFALGLPNGWRYRRLGEKGLETENCQSLEKA